MACKRRSDVHFAADTVCAWAIISPVSAEYTLRVESSSLRANAILDENPLLRFFYLIRSNLVWEHATNR